jgi:hypothetical protein
MTPTKHELQLAWLAHRHLYFGSTCKSVLVNTQHRSRVTTDKTPWNPRRNEENSIRFGGSHDAVSSSLGHAATQLRLLDACGDETTTSPSDMATRDVQAPCRGLDRSSVRQAGDLSAPAALTDRSVGFERRRGIRARGSRRPGVSLGSSPPAIDFCLSRTSTTGNLSHVAKLVVVLVMFVLLERN